MSLGADPENVTAIVVGECEKVHFLICCREYV